MSDDLVRKLKIAAQSLREYGDTVGAQVVLDAAQALSHPPQERTEQGDRLAVLDEAKDAVRAMMKDPRAGPAGKPLDAQAFTWKHCVEVALVRIEALTDKQGTVRDPGAVDEWRRYVLSNEGLRDWTVQESGEGYCWFKTKTIQIPKTATASSFLHEVAHALSQEPEGEHRNHFHGGNWADRYMELTDKYMMVHSVPRAGLPEDVAELVKRLRTYTRLRSPYLEQMREEAADTIERLARELTEADAVIWADHPRNEFAADPHKTWQEQAVARHALRQRSREEVK